MTTATTTEQTRPLPYLPLPNGKYTVVWPQGGHRTFRIRTQPKDSKFAPGMRVISLLTGPDNGHDYTGFGFVMADWTTSHNLIHIYRSKRGGKYEGYAYALWQLAVQGEQSKLYRAGYRLEQSRSCVCCNRELTDPESIRLGIGPVCRERAA